MKQLTIISGASRGIGKAIAEDLKEKIDSNFVLLDSKKVDFENHLAVFDYFEKDLGYDEGYDQVNVILCASILGSHHSWATEEIEKIFKINVLGNMNVFEYAMLKVNKGGKFRVVCVAGGGAAFAYPEYFGYSLSKVAVVRAVENLAKDSFINGDFSIIALAPGAVDTDMLKQQIELGIKPRTKTDISEPVEFVRKFITDEIDSLALNGRFIHVRDDLKDVGDKFYLRRIE